MDWIPVYATISFWACLALVFYAYLGYPLLVWGLSRVFHRPVVPRTGDDAELAEPTI